MIQRVLRPLQIPPITLLLCNTLYLVTLVTSRRSIFRAMFVRVQYRDDVIPISLCRKKKDSGSFVSV